MHAYQQTPAPATAARSGTDVAAWALVALIVAIVCAGAGWAVARQDAPSSEDVAREAELAARESATRGMRSGYSQGADLGRREASFRARLSMLENRRSAAQSGWSAGYAEGRSRAASRAGDEEGLFGGASLPGGAYPALGYEDVLASGMFGDAPGFSDSAYSSFGYGGGVSTPWTSTGAYGGTSRGDDLPY